jgi:hypothetical protein
MPDQQEPRRPQLTDVHGNPIDVDDSAVHEYLDALRRGEVEPSPPLALWWSLSKPDGGGTHMRVTMDDDRWRITDVYIHGSTLSATDLQAVPMTGLNLIMNLVGHWPDGGTTDPDDIAGAHNDLARDAGYGDAVYYDPDADELPLAELRALAVDAPPELPRTPNAERPKLTRPDGTDPEGFAKRVAAAYREYAQTTRAPAVKIAEEAGVPVGTVRGWIREARRRGKLPEGRKGRTG